MRSVEVGQMTFFLISEFKLKGELFFFCFFSQEFFAML